MRFKPFASILAGMFIIGVSVGYLLGFYIQDQYQSYYLMYIAAPSLGLGSGLIIYGTLYGRNVN